MRLLILEDDRCLAQVFAESLEEAGHSVRAAHDNETAVGLLEREAFDLLIFDLLIGDETSIPVLDFANYAAPGAEVILVTGSGLFPRGELHYSVSGISHRLQKPVKLSDLLFLVDHFERTRTAPPAEDRDPQADSRIPA